jgi:hypothetical protein
MREEKLIARLPGIVHGVVVQMTTEASSSSSAGASSVPPASTGNFTQIVSDW